MNNELIQIIKQDLKQNVTGKRYDHIIGVAYTAASIAMRYGYDMEQAFMAGLLHDCAKHMNGAQLIQICEESKVPISDVERRNPFLLHGKVGAIIAKEKYNIVDHVILDSIRYHTTGRPDMTMLDKIIFVADYIEPNRRQLEGLNEVRTLVFQNLDDGVVRILQMTINYLKSNENQEIDSTTLETFQYYNNRKEI